MPASSRRTNRLGERLAGADRALILGLKRQARRHPGFRDTVTSYDLYQFVLAAAGTTLADLTHFAAERQAPVP